MDKTPTIAVFVRGGLVQDVCADFPCRVIVLDFDTERDDDDNTAAHWHPDPTGLMGGAEEERCCINDLDIDAGSVADELPYVLAAIATADEAAREPTPATEVQP